MIRRNSLHFLLCGLVGASASDTVAHLGAMIPGIHRHSDPRQQVSINSGGTVREQGHRDEVPQPLSPETRRLMRVDTPDSPTSPSLATATRANSAWQPAVLLAGDPVSGPKFGHGCDTHTGKTCTFTKCEDWRNAECEEISTPASEGKEGNKEKHCVCPSGKCNDKGACMSDDRASEYKQSDTLLSADGVHECPRFWSHVTDSADCSSRARKLGIKVSKHLGEKFKDKQCVYRGSRICKKGSGEAGIPPAAGGAAAAGAAAGGGAAPASAGDDDYGGAVTPGTGVAAEKKTAGKSDDDYYSDTPAVKNKVDVSKCSYVEGEGNADCPSGTVKAEKWECEKLVDNLGGALGDPFEVEDPSSPKGCYGKKSSDGQEEEFFWNKDTSGAGSAGLMPYCRQCGDAPTPPPTQEPTEFQLEAAEETPAPTPAATVAVTIAPTVAPVVKSGVQRNGRRCAAIAAAAVAVLAVTTDPPR